MSVKFLRLTSTSINSNWTICQHSSILGQQYCLQYKTFVELLRVQAAHNLLFFSNLLIYTLSLPWWWPYITWHNLFDRCSTKIQKEKTNSQKVSSCKYNQTGQNNIPIRLKCYLQTIFLKQWDYTANIIRSINSPSISITAFIIFYRVF